MILIQEGEVVQGNFVSSGQQRRVVLRTTNKYNTNIVQNLETDLVFDDLVERKKIKGIKG